MQEHIRRAHAEHYIPKLPASEESFYLMINTPPKEDPNPAAEAEAEAQASLSIQRSDAPDGMIAHEIQPAPGAPFENALFESFMDDIAHIRGVPEATLLLPDELTNHGIPRASGRSSIDFASAPALDSDPLSAITSEYHASVAQLSEANSIPQDPSMATLHQHISMPVSIWDDDDLQPLPGEDVVTVCNQGTASAEIMNGTYPFFDGDCSMFPNPEPAERKPPPSGRGPSELTGGLGPEIRPTTEVTSINALHHQRAVEARNDMVYAWLQETIGVTMLDPGVAGERPLNATNDDDDDGVPVDELTLGSGTENIAQPGQIYYLEEASGLKDPEDFNIMSLGRHWNDAPARLGISPANCRRTQPATSSAAMARFSKMCEDSAEDPALSIAASCGTRRASLPPIYDVEGSTAGHFLCKMADPVREERPRANPSASKRCVVQETLKRKHCDREEEVLDRPEALFGHVPEEIIYRTQGNVVDTRCERLKTALATPESENQPSERSSADPQTTAAEGSVAFGSPRADSPPTPPSLAQVPCCPPATRFRKDQVEGTTGVDCQAKHELTRADDILGSVLSREDIPRELQEQLAQISSILTTVQSKLP